MEMDKEMQEEMMKHPAMKTLSDFAAKSPFNNLLLVAATILELAMRSKVPMEMKRDTILTTLDLLCHDLTLMAMDSVVAKKKPPIPAAELLMWPKRRHRVIDQLGNLADELAKFKGDNN